MTDETDSITYDDDETEVLIGTASDGVPLDQFEWADRAERMLRADFQVGRDRQPKTDAAGRAVVNTTPHPDLRVWNDPSAPGVSVVALVAGPIVFRAFRTSEPLAAFCEQFVGAIEAGYEGIERVDLTVYDRAAKPVGEAIHDAAMSIDPVSVTVENSE